MMTPKFATQGKAMGERARLYEQLSARETPQRTGRTPLDGVVRAAVRRRGQGSPVAGSVATT